MDSNEGNRIQLSSGDYNPTDFVPPSGSSELSGQYQLSIVKSPSNFVPVLNKSIKRSGTLKSITLKKEGLLCEEENKLSAILGYVEYAVQNIKEVEETSLVRKAMLQCQKDIYHYMMELEEKRRFNIRWDFPKKFQKAIDGVEWQTDRTSDLFKNEAFEDILKSASTSADILRSVRKAPRKPNAVQKGRRGRW